MQKQAAPAAGQKKYSPEHMMLLVLFTTLKHPLDHGYPDTALAPITDRYFGTESGFSIKDIYDEIFQMEKKKLHP